MSPLGISMFFVFISILVSIVRHFFHQSSNISSNDDTNIGLEKIHTIANIKEPSQKKNYNSLYEAFYKPYAKIERKLEYLRENQMQHYNSYALKKALFNNQHVYLCDQKYAAFFDQRTLCEDTVADLKECKWRTTISVYRLPFFKREQVKSLQIDGKIQFDDESDKQITCWKKETNRYNTTYQINFVVILNQKESKKDEGKKNSGWSMNTLTIEQDKQVWKRELGSFQLRLTKWNLKNVNHFPRLYSFNENCLSYITTEEPWLIRYNCADLWRTYNILNEDIQKEIFDVSVNQTVLKPPYATSQTITPKYMTYFESQIKKYTKNEACNHHYCLKREESYQNKFITYVFETINSPLRFGRHLIQITISINEKLSPDIYEISESKPLLVSYKILTSELNPSKASHVNCKIHTQTYKIMKGIYTYQISNNEDNVILSLEKHSLTCISAYHSDQHLKIVEIDNLINNNNYTDDLTADLLMKKKEIIDQKKLEHFLFKRELIQREKEKEDKIEDESSGWFDFDLFSHTYFDDESQDSDIQPSVEQENGESVEDSDATDDKREKDKKGKQKLKARDDKKKGLKPQKKDQRKEDKDKDEKDSSPNEAIKINIDTGVQKVDELLHQFLSIPLEETSFESETRVLIFPMPFLLTSESKLNIISSNPEYPVIYVNPNTKKFLLTYYLKDEEEQSGNDKNESSQIIYLYKYCEIGTDIKPVDRFISLKKDNDTSKKQSKRKDSVQEEIDIDKFIAETLLLDSNIMNRVKSINVVEAKFDGQTNRERQLKGLMKPYKKQVVVLWGWGVEVYELDWDKKRLKPDILQIEEHLNRDNEANGLEMIYLMPFIELFATVYCMFQALIPNR